MRNSLRGVLAATCNNLSMKLNSLHSGNKQTNKHLICLNAPWIGDANALKGESVLDLAVVQVVLVGDIENIEFQKKRD